MKKVSLCLICAIFMLFTGCHFVLNDRAKMDGRSTAEVS